MHGITVHLTSIISERGMLYPLHSSSDMKRSSLTLADMMIWREKLISAPEKNDTSHIQGVSA
jgi:hypothetical protein